MYFKIRLADVIIGVNAQYVYLKEYCEKYTVEEGTPEFTIQLTMNDIRAEGKYMDSDEAARQLPYLETLAALRKIADYMPLQNRFLMHGAVLSWKGNGLMFTAPSGTGKSTHIDLWKRYLGEEVEIINGDKPILWVTEKEIRVYGTPWAGKERWENNKGVPLKGVCFLQRGSLNEIKRITPSEAMPLLLRQVYYTSDPQMAGKILELLDKMFVTVPFYMMKCNISEEAVRCSFEAMTGEESRKEQ